MIQDLNNKWQENMTNFFIPYSWRCVTRWGKNLETFQEEELSEEFNKMDPNSGDSNASVGSNTHMNGMLEWYNFKFIQNEHRYELL